MDELEKREFELHSKTDGYRERIGRAKRWIELVFDRYDQPCINYSGGKDSSVLLHLVTQKLGYLDVPVYYFDNGLLEVPGSTEFVRNFVEKHGGDLYVETSEKVNDPSKMLLEVGHGYNGFFGLYSELAGQHGWDIRVLGIRSEESNKREDRFGEPPINPGEQFGAAAPIHQLETMDIWSYIVDNDLDYHSIYDRQARLYDAIDHRDNRLVTLYDSEFESHGSFEVSMFLYPGKTNRLREAEREVKRDDG